MILKKQPIDKFLKECNRMMNESLYPMCPISGETLQEEKVNYFTHYMGLLLSLIGTLFLIIYAILSSDVYYIVSCSVYSTTLILMYAASSYYHSCSILEHKRLLRTADHMCIYLLIAGSYTPFTLGPLRETVGWSLLSVEWACVCLGILFKMIAAHRFRILSVFIYLLMGWLIVFFLPLLTEALSANSFYWLVAGGLSYSVGVFFFMWESLPFNHSIWHVFVLGGSACHYFSILNLIPL
jgi:hemolysin III